MDTPNDWIGKLFYVSLVTPEMLETVKAQSKDSRSSEKYQKLRVVIHTSEEKYTCLRFQNIFNLSCQANNYNAHS